MDNIDINKINIDNISAVVVAPEIKPFLWVENNQVRSGFEKLSTITAFFPRNVKFYSVPGYDVGSEQKDGNFSGLLGRVQRGEADSLFHPMPLAFEAKNTFLYTIPLYEDSFGTFSLVRYPPHYTNDLTNCFFDFKPDVMIIFLAFYFLICLILTYFFSMQLKESALVVYRIMFKEHNLKLNDFLQHSLFHRNFLACVLIYYLLLNIVVESNISMNLVVSQSPAYIDTLKQLYEDKKWVIHFIRGHYTLSYFKNSNGDERLKDIYERATVKCKDCVHDQQDYLPLVYNENEELLSTPNHLLITDSTFATYMRKGACNQNSNWIIKKGIIRFAPVISKQLFTFILRKELANTYKERLLNVKLRRFVESGISLYFEASVRGQIFGFIKNTTPNYERCRNANSISTLESNSYAPIKLENIIRFALSIVLFFSLLALAQLLHHAALRYYHRRHRTRSTGQEVPQQSARPSNASAIASIRSHSG